MKDIIELYINKQKVYFEQDPNILFTYSHSDLHNPTIVKNSFSKTLTILGTPENNRIFNNFYDMKRINKGELFNPSRKEQFELYRNGELIESGYVRLDKVNRNQGQITYSISLFGGLGEFLYNLSFNENGDQMKLSDLTYDVDMNMTINKKTIKDAWLKVTGVNENVDNADVYDVVNFAPSYNGIPDDFSSDKVAIDVESFRLNNPQLYNQFVSTDENFTTVNGWISAELAKEYDEWQMKDLRSYLQRPVFRFKEIIKSCCKPENNGGYVVKLDEDFFNSENPYYENAWMTLPLVRDTKGADEDIVVTIDGDNVILPTDTEGYVRLSVNASLVATADTDEDFLWTGAIRYNQSVVTTQYNRAYYIQLVVYTADGTQVATSPCNVFYTAIGRTTDFNIEPVTETTINTITGQFDRQVNGTYVFNGQGYDLTTNTFKYEKGMYGRIYIKTDTISIRGDFKDNYLFTNKGKTPFYVESVVSFGYRNEALKTTGELGYYLTKKKILNTDKTPCDYFLSYMKMFNMHIWKDTFDDVIYVKQRKNYFTGEVKDIEEYIDTGDSVDITPIIFNNKWLNLNAGVIKSGASEKYNGEYGVEYGCQKIDTNYNFDTSTKNLLENFAFKTAVQMRNKSKYYVDTYQEFEDDDVFYPPFMLDGIQPFFYGANGDTVEGNYISPKTTQTSINWWEDKYYDLLPKPMFADKENKGIEGDGVLLFYSGKVEMKDVNGNRMYFQITDDIPEFDRLNEGEPCWIWSMDWDVSIDYLNYFPSFSRYIVNENNWVTHSWDFGTPREIYIPDVSIDTTSSLYDKYWKPYIQDQYSSDTRKVNCFVLLRQIIAEKLLRDFYYFEGRYWMLNVISDYNPSSDGLTKCEFVSINNIQNYLN